MTTSTTPPVDNSALQELVAFIERNEAYSDEGGRVSDVFPQEGSRDEYPALSIALGHWVDGSDEYVTFDLNYGCTRWPGLLEATATDNLQWRFGAPPSGVGIEDSLEDCDLDPSTFPEIFSQFQSENGSTDIAVIVADEQTITVEAGGFSQAFSS